MAPWGFNFQAAFSTGWLGSRTNELAKYGWLNFVRLPCSPAKTIGDIQLQICRFETSRDDETTEYLAFEPLLNSPALTGHGLLPEK